MKDFLLLIIVVLLLSPSTASLLPANDDYDYQLAEGMVAMQVVNTDFSSATQPDKVIPKPLCKCGGTGKERSGDGLIELPCVCSPNCKCAKTGDVQSDVYTSYYFTASWCGPCNTFHTVDIPSLEKSGWIFVKNKWVRGANVVIMDIDKADNRAKFNEYKDSDTQVIPYFVMTKNGKKIKSRSGYVGFIEYANWHNNAITDDKGNK
jgi:thiol-disulfide isomerase/thioredoxin